MILRKFLVILVGVLVSCSEEKSPIDSDQTPELLKLAERIVSGMDAKSIEKAHSHSSIHSELQLTANVTVKFDTEENAQRIAGNIRSVFENRGYTTLFFNNQSQGFDREPGVKHIGLGGWSGSGNSDFHPSLGVDRHVEVETGSGDVFIRERLRLSGVFGKKDHQVAFHLWLFPEEGRCYASFSIVNEG